MTRKYYANPLDLLSARRWVSINTKRLGPPQLRGRESSPKRHAGSVEEKVNKYKHQAKVDKKSDAIRTDKLTKNKGNLDLEASRHDAACLQKQKYAAARGVYSSEKKHNVQPQGVGSTSITTTSYLKIKPFEQSNNKGKKINSDFSSKVNPYWKSHAAVHFKREIDIGNEAGKKNSQKLIDYPAGQRSRQVGHNVQQVGKDKLFDDQLAMEGRSSTKSLSNTTKYARSPDSNAYSRNYSETKVYSKKPTYAKFYSKSPDPERIGKKLANGFPTFKTGASANQSVRHSEHDKMTLPQRGIPRP